MKLYQFPPSPRSRKCLALAHHLGLAVETVNVDLPKGEHLKPDFIRLNPNHKIPVLVDGDLVLWESNAISLYLCSKAPGNTLFPDDAKTQADIYRWQFWEAAHWDPACAVFVFERLVKPMLHLGDPDPQAIEKGEEQFHRFAKVLDDYLRGRQWLINDQLSLADFCVAPMLALSEPAAYPIEPYHEIKRWYVVFSKLDAWQRSAPPA